MSSVLQCPKCGFSGKSFFTECPRCGIVVEKYLQNQKQADERRQEDNALAGSMQNMKLAAADSLMIRQKKEWGEIVTDFETVNRYEVMDGGGRHLYMAVEAPGTLGTLLSRWFLRALRPFSMDVASPLEGTLIWLQRPFRFYFHRIDVQNADGDIIGIIQRRFHLLRRIYSVMDQHGNDLYTLFGPILHPWTFEIQQGGRTVGKITKKWSGMLKEGFTDADNFGVVFPPGIDARHKSILLGAVFLIDFVHFER